MNRPVSASFVRGFGTVFSRSRLFAARTTDRCHVASKHMKVIPEVRPSTCSAGSQRIFSRASANPRLMLRPRTELLTAGRRQHRSRSVINPHTAVGIRGTCIASTKGQAGELDVSAARRDTPGTRHVVHLNNAGASLMPQTVVDTCKRYLDDEAAQGGYETADAWAGVLDRTYGALAEVLNCEPSDIAVVNSATTAWQVAFYGLRFRPGERILTSQAEYGSNYIAFLQVCERTGAVVEAIPDDEWGQVDVAALEAMLEAAAEGTDGAGPVRLLAVTHIPTSSGLVNPAAAIGALAERYKVPFLLDACQSVGQVPVDVQELKCDFLTGTGRKYLRAPRGTGFLYARRGGAAFEPGFLDNVGARWTSPSSFRLAPGARKYETYEQNFAGKAGLSVALDYFLGLGGAEAVWPRIRDLAARLRTLLREIPAVEVHDRGQVLSGLVSFTVAGRAADEVQRACGAAGVNVSVSTAKSTLLQFSERGLTNVVRASVHYFNTEEDLAALISVLTTL